MRFQSTRPALASICSERERAGVLHRGGDVVALASGVIFHPLVGPFAHLDAREKGAGGDRVALQHERRAAGVGGGVRGAVLLHFGRVAEVHVLGQMEGPIGERGIQMVRLAPVFGARGFIGLGLAERHEAGGPIGGDFAAVDLVAQVAIHHPFGPRGRSERCVGGIDARDARDDPVGLAQIEARVESQGHDAAGGFGGAHAREHREDSVAIHAQVVIGLGQRKDLVEMIALHPILQLARPVACVGAGFEHGHDDDFDRDWRVLRQRSGTAQRMPRNRVDRRYVTSHES